jgi:uridine kinase
LYDRRIRDLMRYKIFINCDGKAWLISDDVRLCRRIKRDVEERGRTV